MKGNVIYLNIIWIVIYWKDFKALLNVDMFMTRSLYLWLNPSLTPSLSLSISLSLSVPLSLFPLYYTISFTLSQTMSSFSSLFFSLYDCIPPLSICLSLYNLSLYISHCISSSFTISHPSIPSLIFVFLFSFQ